MVCILICSVSAVVLDRVALCPPALFNLLFINAIIMCLKSEGVGCWVSQTYVGCVLMLTQSVTARLADYA